MEVTVTAQHRGHPVGIPYDQKVAQELCDRASRIARKFAERGREETAARYQAEVREWEAIIKNPESIALYPQRAKEYVDHVLFSEQGWRAMFGTGDKIAE